jgi:4-hydroxy-4-methyl-2-oxoglutarate aldolase
MIHIVKTVRRPDKTIVDSFAKIAPATVHEAMGRTGAMVFEIKPIYSGMRVCGPAITAECHPGDNSMLHMALAVAQPGDVIVATMGRVDMGSWGEVLSTCAMARGIAGLIVDGMVRDGLGIKELGFPVFARGLCMRGTVKETVGLVNHQISCGGMIVNPGDLVLGDDDGVVVISRENATQDLIQKCEEKEAHEREMMKRFRAELGLTTADLLGLRDRFRAKGMREEA